MYILIFYNTLIFIHFFDESKCNLGLDLGRFGICHLRATEPVLFTPPSPPILSPLYFLFFSHPRGSSFAFFCCQLQRLPLPTNCQISQRRFDSIRFDSTLTHRPFIKHVQEGATHN